MGFGSWGLFVLVVVPLLQVPGIFLLSRYVQQDGEAIPPQPVRREIIPTDQTARATGGISKRRMVYVPERGKAFSLHGFQG
jgi:hypothetical protein